jgi:fatty aldehyde-generating acyl-ACP reductase
MSTNHKLEHLDFAVIGHQESWDDIKAFINGMRSSKVGDLSLEQVKNTFGYIPPRSIFKMKVRSKTGVLIHGAYIETFIEPDKLGPQYVRTNIKKVNEAIAVAQNLKAKIIALGGFTSIVLEGNLSAFNTAETKITTGNSLTSAYILKGIEKASEKFNIKLNASSVLIIGATGDIGMACTNYLKGQVKTLLLCARNKKRLETFSNEISEEGYSVKYNTDLNRLIALADIIISAASSNDIAIENYKKPFIICDAGYPKNLELKIDDKNGISLFHGGMGQIGYGYDFNPDYSEHFYRYPVPHIGHGCVLEAIVLAFENKFENYSSGKGNISNQKIEDIYAMSVKHGLDIAPFYNSKGLWA